MIKRVDQEPRPRLGLKKRATFPCGRGDHIGLGIVRRMFSLRLHLSAASIPSAAKAASLLASVTARLEGVPFQSDCSQSTVTVTHQLASPSASIWIPCCEHIVDDLL